MRATQGRETQLWKGWAGPKAAKQVLCLNLEVGFVGSEAELEVGSGRAGRKACSACAACQTQTAAFTATSS
jgi:hypothetical protein